MGDAKYYKCKSCGYEFLSKNMSPSCPGCKSNKLELRDLNILTGMDE